MYNLVSGWILWYVCFFSMPCSLIKPCLKTKTKYWKLCTLVGNATSFGGMERGENLLLHIPGCVVVWLQVLWERRSTDLGRSICSFLRVFSPPLCCVLKITVLVSHADWVILIELVIIYICHLISLCLWFQGTQDTLWPCVLYIPMILSTCVVWQILTTAWKKRWGQSMQTLCVYFYVGIGCFSLLLFKLKS